MFPLILKEFNLGESLYHGKFSCICVVQLQLATLSGHIIMFRIALTVMFRIRKHWQQHALKKWGCGVPPKRTTLCIKPQVGLLKKKSNRTWMNPFSFFIYLFCLISRGLKSRGNNNIYLFFFYCEKYWTN